MTQLGVLGELMIKELAEAAAIRPFNSGVLTDATCGLGAQAHLQQHLQQRLERPCLIDIG